MRSRREQARVPFLDLSLILGLADGRTSQIINCYGYGPQAWTRLIEQVNFLACKCKRYRIPICIGNMQCPLIGAIHTRLTCPATTIGKPGICVIVGIGGGRGAEGRGGGR